MLPLVTRNTVFMRMEHVGVMTHDAHLHTCCEFTGQLLAPLSHVHSRTLKQRHYLRRHSKIYGKIDGKEAIR